MIEQNLSQSNESSQKLQKFTINYNVNQGSQHIEKIK